MLTRQTKEQEKTSSVRPRRDPEASGPQAAAQTRSFFRLPAAAPPVVQMMPLGAGSGWETLNLSTKDRRLVARQTRQTGAQPPIVCPRVQRNAGQRVTGRLAARQREAEQLAAGQREAEQLAARQREARQREAEQLAAELAARQREARQTRQTGAQPPIVCPRVQRNAGQRVTGRLAARQGFQPVVAEPRPALLVVRRQPDAFTPEDAGSIALQREHIQRYLPQWYVEKVQQKKWYREMLQNQLEQVYTLDLLCIQTDSLMDYLEKDDLIKDNFGKGTRDALKSYVGASFNSINSFLRSVKIRTSFEKQQAEKYAPQIIRAEPLFPRTFAPITVYRGAKSVMGEDGLLYDLKKLEIQTPDYIVEKAFLSTSARRSYASGLATNGVLLEISVPAGTPALFVTAKLEGRDTAGKLRNEDEVIFPHNRRMRVIRNRFETDKAIISVEMENL